MNRGRVLSVVVPVGILVTLLVTLRMSVGLASADGDGSDSFGEVGRATAVDEPQNVCASELLGKWKSDKEISQSLGKMQDNVVTHYAFDRNEVSSARILKALETHLVELKASGVEEQGILAEHLQRALQAVYLTGELTQSKGGIAQKVDFALVSMYGNPRLLLYYPKQEDFEYGNIMVARDAKGNGDLLFLGGDKNNQGFLALRRVED